MLREIAFALPALLLVVLPPTVVDSLASAVVVAAVNLSVGVHVAPAPFLFVPAAVLDPALLPQASLEDYVADVRLAVDPVMLAFVALRLPCVASPLPTIGRQRGSEKSGWDEAAV